MLPINKKMLAASLAVVSMVLPAVLGNPAQVEAKDKKAGSASSVACQTSLHSLRHAAARVQREVLQVVNDISQTKMTDVEGDPIFFQPTLKQERESSVWAQEIKDDGGILEQPKKKWLDTDTLQLTQAVTELTNEFNALPKADAGSSCEAPRATMKTIIDDMNTHLKALMDLTAGPKYDNLAIGAAALVIRDDVTKLEKPWKEMVKACN